MKLCTPKMFSLTLRFWYTANLCYNNDRYNIAFYRSFDIVFQFKRFYFTTEQHIIIIGQNYTLNR